MPPKVPAGDTRRAVIRASLVTVTGILGSRVLGLVRVQVLSAQFGAADAGALRAAFDLPDLLFYLVAGGALRSGFVPVFTELLTKGRDDPRQWQRAWWLFSVLVTLVAVISGVLVTLGVVFADALTAPMTGRWSGEGYSPEATQLTIFLTRIVLPAQLFLLVGGVFTGALDALKQFTVSAAVPNFYNLSIIGAMLLLGHRYGVASAAYGTVFGAFVAHFLWQGWALWRHARPYGITYRPVLVVRDELVLRVLKVAGPIVLGLCVAEINLKVSGWVVAPFGERARAWFDNASRIARLPDGIFGAGLGVALFPYLSQLAVEGRVEEFRRQAEHTLRLALVCAMPCAALLACGAHPIVGVLFGHGRFGPDDVVATSQMLPLFALGVVPITLQVVVTRAFYANEDSLTPVRVGALAVVIGVGLNLLLGKLIGRLGPPLALSLTSALNVLGLLWLYGRRFGYADAPRLVQVSVVSFLAAVATGAVIAAVLAVPQLQTLGHLPRTLLATALCFVFYVHVLRFVGVQEVDDVIRLARRPRRESAS